MFFVKILGPVIGLLVGGQLNKLYVDFNRKFSMILLNFNFFETKINRLQITFLNLQTFGNLPSAFF